MRTKDKKRQYQKAGHRLLQVNVVSQARSPFILCVNPVTVASC